MKEIFPVLGLERTEGTESLFNLSPGCTANQPESLAAPASVERAAASFHRSAEGAYLYVVTPGSIDVDS